MAEAERTSQKAIGYAVVVVIAAASYYVAQTSINAHLFRLSGLDYIACLQRVSMIDWDKYGIENPPSSSEICKERTQR